MICGRPVAIQARAAEQYFRRVKVAFGGIMWPHEQDFSAEPVEYEMQRGKHANRPPW